MSEEAHAFQQIAERSTAALKKREAALKLVLLWHSAPPWDLTEQGRWEGLLKDIYGSAYDGLAWKDACSKVLCDAVREALK